MDKLFHRLFAQVDAALRAGIRRLTPEGGATAVEYGLIVALIAVVIIVAVATLGTQIRDGFCFVVTEISQNTDLGGTCSAD